MSDIVERLRRCTGLGADFYETEILEAIAEIERLREELIDQWLSNHAEHCGARVPPWPHPGICHWPMPEVLADFISQ
jgi:hypothetical protein